MRLTWVDVVDDSLVGEKTNILRDEIEVYTRQKLAVILERGVVSTNRRMASSVFGGNLLDRDGTVYMAKECQVQEGK